MDTKVNKNIYDLEYKNRELAEIISHMNKVLANYQVFYHKVRGFSWNIVGQDYFDMRSQFEKLSENALKNCNEIAERIRIFNQTPPGLLEEYQELSTIDENEFNQSGFEMVKVVLQDILTLLSNIKEAIKSAIEFGDYGTEYLLKKIIFELEKEHRALLSWLK